MIFSFSVLDFARGKNAELGRGFVKSLSASVKLEARFSKIWDFCSRSELSWLTAAETAPMQTKKKAVTILTKRQESGKVTALFS